MIWSRHLKLFTKLVVAVLALGALATCGNAQNAYQGKFTLPFEAHWGSVTLPAGDYTFAMRSASVPYVLQIQGGATNTNTFIMAITADPKVASGHAQLNLVDIAGEQSVETFEAPELGLTFSYATPKQKHVGNNGNRQKAVPQTVTDSQISENRTSIQVRSAGR
jgi:hypothetical protein